MTRALKTRSFESSITYCIIIIFKEFCGALQRF